MPEVVKIIDEEAAKYMVKSAATSQADHDWGIDKLRGAGVKIRQVDPAVKLAWAKKVGRLAQLSCTGRIQEKENRYGSGNA